MAASPSDRRYSETHEWFRVDDETVTVGLTRFAVDELTDVTYVELRPPGTSVRAGDVLGEVESVKSSSDIYTSVPGEIVEVNDALSADPSLLNSDPFEMGWLLKIKASDPAALDALMDQATYDAKHPVA